MTTACHAAAGALAGSFTGSPVVGLVGGLVSHAVLDVVPHYDLSDYRVDVVLTVTVAVALGIVSGGNAAILWGMVGGILPDLENLFMKLGWMRPERRIFPTHDGPLPHGRALGVGHAIWQVAIVILAFGRAAS